MPGQPVAIIDIGSNSVRLVVYEALSRAATPFYNEKVLCGLGRNVLTTRHLADEAVERALRALARFKILCRTMEVGEIRALATAAVRDAENGTAFIEAAERACGVKIELLSGAREAQLSAFGVISGFYEPDGVVGDLGGGSLELVDVSGPFAGQGETFPLGGLALQDLSGGSLKKAQKLVRDALDKAPLLKNLKNRTFYAVGGTWRSLAKLHMAARDYPLRVMHGYELNPNEGLDFLNLVENTEAQNLKDIDVVADARRPLLAYGALVLEEIIRTGRPEKVVLSALGVREGLLFDMLTPLERSEDPLLVAAGALNILRSRSPQHGDDLMKWSDAFMLSSGVDESVFERRLRHAACLLADIGWRAHPDYRGEQSLNIIAHAAFVGIDHPGRAFIALAIFFRYEGLSLDKVSPKLKSLVTPRLLERARLLGALMRVAYPISAAMGGILTHTPLRMDHGQIVLNLPENMTELGSERLINRLKQLGKITARESFIVMNGSND
jgi:exopolyphosphatase / guanosine-5'-triphosphate,3'-diphosphate pyrophosphatase